MSQFVNERSVEIPFVLANLPPQGKILDVGSNEALYLDAVVAPRRELFCLDPRPREKNIPEGVQFIEKSILQSGLPMGYFDYILAISTIEHIGLACYEQATIENGDHLAMRAIYELMRGGGTLLLTVPVGAPRIESWFRQYSLDQLKALLKDFVIEQQDYYGLSVKQNCYYPIGTKAIPTFNYRLADHFSDGHRAGAVACIKARKLVF